MLITSAAKYLIRTLKSMIQVFQLDIFSDIVDVNNVKGRMIRTELNPQPGYPSRSRDGHVRDPDERVST